MDDDPIPISLRSAPPIQPDSNTPDIPEPISSGLH